MRLYAVLAIAIVAVSQPQTAEADSLNGFMRRLGFGWSDGYHHHNTTRSAPHPTRGTPLQYDPHQVHTMPMQPSMGPGGVGLGPARRQQLIPAPVPTAPQANRMRAPAHPHGRAPLVPPAVKKRRPAPNAFRWSTAKLPR